MEAELLRLLNVVLRNKGQPGIREISPECHLRDELHLDSLDLAEFTVRIEERFGIDVFDRGIIHRWYEIETRLKEKHGPRGE